MMDPTSALLEPRKLLQRMTDTPESIYRILRTQFMWVYFIDVDNVDTVSVPYILTRNLTLTVKVSVPVLSLSNDTSDLTWQCHVLCGICKSVIQTIVHKKLIKIELTFSVNCYVREPLTMRTIIVHPSAFAYTSVIRSNIVPFLHVLF